MRRRLAEATISARIILVKCEYENGQWELAHRPLPFRGHRRSYFLNQILLSPTTVPSARDE
eukprot:scaffold140372_cov13-Prasinocladus_malaysianus.AAC.1